jgi:hypothetical protein
VVDNKCLKVLITESGHTTIPKSKPIGALSHKLSIEFITVFQLRTCSQFVLTGAPASICIDSSFFISMTFCFQTAGPRKHLGSRSDLGQNFRTRFRGRAPGGYLDRPHPPCRPVSVSVSCWVWHLHGTRFTARLYEKSRAFHLLHRFGLLDISCSPRHVRFTPQSGHVQCNYVRFGPKADSRTAANSIAIRSPHRRS